MRPKPRASFQAIAKPHNPNADAQWRLEKLDQTMPINLTARTE
jgi:hypothetical protein